MNPLFNISQSPQNPLSSFKNIGSIISLLKGQNPNTVITELLRTNPQFKQFYELNKGKTPDEIAKSYGIDMNLIRQYLK